MTEPRADRPDRYEQLAMYNAERARGIVHTAEYDAKMAREQERWDEQHYAAEALLGLR